MMRNAKSPSSRWLFGGLLVAGVAGSTGCLPENFAESLAGNTANRLSNFFLETFVIEPIDDAVEAARNPDEG